MTKESAKERVDQYFQMISLEASPSDVEFWDMLHRRHGNLANQFEKAASARKSENSEDIYIVKNSSLDFGLDVAKMLADFYKHYCLWFASMENPHPKRLLDIGCDNGIITCFYAYLFLEADIIGIDKLEQGIRCAGELAERLGLSNVSFQKMDFKEISKYYSNSPFDMVTSVRTLHEVMGTIPFPIYWSLKDYLEEYPVRSEYRYIEVIEKVMQDGGKYISAERLENPAAVGQWANLLTLAGLSLDWRNSGFIEFHETGTNHKTPIMIASKMVSELDTMEGLKLLYTRDIDLSTEINGSYRSVAAELLFGQFTRKQFQFGKILEFDQNWYKMRFEIWRTNDHLLVYGYGNMGYRQLEVLSLDALIQAEEKMNEFLNQYVQHGKVKEYSTIKERDSIS